MFKSGQSSSFSSLSIAFYIMITYRSPTNIVTSQVLFIVHRYFSIPDSLPKCAWDTATSDVLGQH